MATVFRCDICKEEKENREGFVCSVTLPLAGRYNRNLDAATLDTKDYDICVECAKYLNDALETRQRAHAKDK